MKQLEMYGLEAKGIKLHAGHEGESLRQANIYFNNKKVMFFSDGDWGGSPRYNFYSDDEALKTAVNEALVKLSKDVRGPYDGNIELALHEVVTMKSVESDLKKYSKKTPTQLVCFFDKNGIALDSYTLETADTVTLEIIKEVFPELYERADLIEVSKLNEKNRIEKYQHTF